MRLYAGSSSQFIKDTVLNQISEKLKNSFFNYYRHNPSISEINSWKNSLRAMAQVFDYSGLDDHGVILEYQLPLSSKRLDCMICGLNKEKKQSAVIIELKQWDKCVESEIPNEVMTFVGGNMRDVLHPSVQVNQYKTYLQDTHTAFYESDPVLLDACSYLHNYNYYSEDVIFDKKFESIISEAPLFTADNVEQLSNFLITRLENGDGLDVLQRIEESKYRPSKKLMIHVSEVIKGSNEYVLLDEQKVAYDRVIHEVRKGFHDKQKAVVIIKGGPGTGKSVIAINLMADLLMENYNAQYATGSRAFTETLREAIGKRGAPQFKYFNSYKDAEENKVDIIISDEAHRIRETSNFQYTPRAQRSTIPQIQELINAAKVNVFFIDDDQVVRPNEIGSSTFIKEWAKKINTKLFEYQLEIQFRCAGAESFINWINNTLGIHKTANPIWGGDENFEFRILSSPAELETEIRDKLKDGHKARITAGFCWPWSRADQDGNLVNDVEIEEYKRPWNSKPENRRLKPDVPKSNLWAYDPNGINQIGCIYTAQGFEFDYVGVIFGPDLKYDLDNGMWVGDKEFSYDSVVKRSGDRFVDLIKNTYRVLLSRGMKGCYVHFMDKDTERFFRSRMD